MNSLIALVAASAYLDVSLGSSVDDDEEPEDDNDDEGGNEPVAEAKPAKKKVKKGGKKVSKKESKKASKSDKSDKNIVRLKDLAKQSKLTEAVCRKKLRDAEVPRGEGRWSWELGSKALKQARKALGLAS